MVGKTFLSIVLGVIACKYGIEVKFFKDLSTGKQACLKPRKIIHCLLL